MQNYVCFLLVNDGLWNPSYFLFGSDCQGAQLNLMLNAEPIIYLGMESEREVTQSCLTLVTPWTVAYLAPLSMGFSRQEYWSGLPFPSPGDLPDPGIEPGSPALQTDALPSEPPGKYGEPLLLVFIIQLIFHVLPLFLRILLNVCLMGLKPSCATDWNKKHLTETPR